jgi:hypothetical protein
VAVTLLAFPLAALLSFASSVAVAAGSDDLAGLLWVSSNFVVIFSSGLLGYWLSLGIRLWRARIRRGNVQEARAALDPPRGDGT